MAQKKLRADQLLVELGLAPTRELAKRLIMAGEVFLLRGAGKEKLDKPGRQLAPDTQLELRARERFVSRGAYKLLTAIEEFGIDFTGKTALDAGAATGGFTDCMLQHGALRVYAADVGRGQLHERLRQDQRVVSLEQVNLRLAPPDLLPEQVDVFTADLSFISLTLVLEPCLRFLKPTAELVVLVKPQFELGPGRTDKGVVRSAADQQEAVDKIHAFVSTVCGCGVRGVVPSKILGPKGNQEYLLYAVRTDAPS